MDKCPKCGYQEILCDDPGCEREAVYEAWFRVRDGFGIPTGLIQRRLCCKVHAQYSIVREGEDAKV